MTAYVYPNRGAEESVARALLGCARSRYDVQTNTDDGLAFVVPDYLADEYEAQQREAAGATTADDTDEPQPAAPPRRRPAAKEGKTNDD